MPGHLSPKRLHNWAKSSYCDYGSGTQSTPMMAERKLWGKHLHVTLFFASNVGLPFGNTFPKAESRETTGVVHIGQLSRTDSGVEQAENCSEKPK